MICLRVSFVALLAAVTLALLLALCLTCEQSNAQESLARYTRQADDNDDDNNDDSGNNADLDDSDDQQAVDRKTSPRPRGGSSTTSRGGTGRRSTTMRIPGPRTSPRGRPGSKPTGRVITSARPGQPTGKDGPPPRAICVYQNRKLTTIYKKPYDLNFDPFCHVGECNAKSKTKCPGNPYAPPNPVNYPTRAPKRRLEPWEIPTDWPTDWPIPTNLPKPPKWWLNKTKRPSPKARANGEDQDTGDDQGDEEQDD